MDFLLVYLIIMGLSLIIMFVYSATGSIASVMSCVLVGFMIIFCLVIVPALIEDDEIVVSHECIPSSTIESMISSNETMQGNVIVEIQIENNISITSFGINAICIDTYHQFDKIETTEETYGFLSLDIYMNDTACFISNFSNGTIHVNQTAYPDLLPMNLIDDAKLILMYTFSVPEDCPYTFVTSYDSDVFQYMNYEKENESSILDDVFGFGDTMPYLLLCIICIFVSVSMVIFPWYRRRSRRLKYSPSSYSSPLRPTSDVYERWLRSQRQGKAHQSSKPKSKYGNIPEECGDYRLSGPLTTADKAMEQAREFRENGHWVRITNFAEKNASVGGRRCCGVYISSWTKDEQDRGVPEPEWKN